MFSTCMNDYLYVWDLEHDVYYITERAVARFDLPSNVFQNVDEVHKRVVHPDDYNLLLTDMSEMRSGRKFWHNLRYRWMSVNQGTGLDQLSGAYDPFGGWQSLSYDRLHQ